MSSGTLSKFQGCVLSLRTLVGTKERKERTIVGTLWDVLSTENGQNKSGLVLKAPITVDNLQWQDKTGNAQLFISYVSSEMGSTLLL